MLAISDTAVRSRVMDEWSCITETDNSTHWHSINPSPMCAVNSSKFHSDLDVNNFWEERYSRISIISTPSKWKHDQVEHKTHTNFTGLVSWEHSNLSYLFYTLFLHFIFWSMPSLSTTTSGTNELYFWKLKVLEYKVWLFAEWIAQSVAVRMAVKAEFMNAKTNRNA